MVSHLLFDQYIFGWDHELKVTEVPVVSIICVDEDGKSAVWSVYAI